MLVLGKYYTRYYIYYSWYFMMMIWMMMIMSRWLAGCGVTQYPWLAVDGGAHDDDMHSFILPTRYYIPLSSYLLPGTLDMPSESMHATT